MLATSSRVRLDDFVSSFSSRQYLAPDGQLSTVSQDDMATRGSHSDFLSALNTSSLSLAHKNERVVLLDSTRTFEQQIFDSR